LRNCVYTSGGANWGNGNNGCLFHLRRFCKKLRSFGNLSCAWEPSAIIIIEFPDLERAKTWYRSAEYAAALAVRDQAISRDMILVEGMT
jgi:uncharacterized protein (DUF1330 family)